MSHSLTTVAGQPDGHIHHALSNSEITIKHTADGAMIHHVAAGGLSAEYPIAYAVGTGKVGFSYLISLPPYLFQSPISYYTHGSQWDVTPGYEPEHVLDFTHPISEGCVFCHSNTVNLVPGTDNQFRQPALDPISCERCHGSAEAHLKNPGPGTIVNPAKLPKVARDSTCEQCHLEGEVRILNPGKHWLDFRPGAALESVFSTYLTPKPASAGDKAVSQSEQLSASRCARESGGRLWCGTCHSPHSAATNRAQEVRGICLSCHTSLFTAQQHKPAQECVSCHMPRLRPYNVAHAAITNHRIILPSSAAAPSNAQPVASELTAWRQPPADLADRNLGLALFDVGRSDRNWDEVYRSYRILSHLPRRDPPVLATLAAILLQQNHPDTAADLLREATAKEPRNSHYFYLLGVALSAKGDQQNAIIALRHSIELDRSVPDPYRKLSEIYQQTGMHAFSKQVIEDYLKFMPQNLVERRAQQSLQ